MTITINTYAQGHRRQGEVIAPEDIDGVCYDQMVFKDKIDARDWCVKMIKSTESKWEQHDKFTRTRCNHILTYIRTTTESE